MLIKMLTQSDAAFEMNVLLTCSVQRNGLVGVGAVCYLRMGPEESPHLKDTV